MQQHRSARIAFVIPPTGLYCREDRCQSLFDPKLIPTVRAPLEECEAAGAAAAAGGAATVIDAPVLGLSCTQVCASLTLFKPDTVIVTVTFGSLDDDLLFCEYLRATYPNIRIGVRGAPAYVWAEKILQNPAVDITLSGDYELCIKDLIQGVSSPRGVTERRDGQIINRPPAYTKELENLPFPDRSSIKEDRYRVRFLGKTQATVRVQRGCPFPCTYCLVHTVSGNIARHRRPQEVADEISHLQARGINYLYLRAETFSINRRWALELCKTLKARCPGVRWVTTTRVECVDEEVLTAMRDSGCYGISFGVDVGSELIAKLVNKPLDCERAMKAMQLCDKVGIVSLAYIMIGFIWDSPETLNETREFIRKLRPDLITVHYAHPYPGTPYHQVVAGLGKANEISRLDAQSAPALPLRALSRNELEAWGRRILLAHYLRPKPLLSLIGKAFTFLVSAKSNRSQSFPAPDSTVASTSS